MPRPDVLLERRVRLAPEAASAGQARRVLRQALIDAERERWLDDAELALSEVVTNAVLHAHTAIDVHINVCASSLCVEVRDYDPTIPVPRNYGDEATTGRGIALVASICRDSGVHSLSGEVGGKVVWFAMGDDDASTSLSADEVLEAWDIDDDAAWDVDGATTAEPAASVVLAGIPVQLWFAAREHHDAIIREFGLLLARIPRDGYDVAAADRARAAISTALAAAAEADRSAATVDLEVRVPVDGAWRFRALQHVLDTAESLAATGELLVHAALPEIVAVRNWACDEVVAQLAGDPPTPWAGTAQPRFETEARDDVRSRASAWDASTVTTSTERVVAADDTNRIIAVSRPLAALLAWDPDRLVGRRIITIIPPELREAHVAGFTRHLTTGETRVLGSPVELPVLAHDGSTITCRLLIERVDGESGGRAIYVARIDPVG